MKSREGVNLADLFDCLHNQVRLVNQVIRAEENVTLPVKTKTTTNNNNTKST